MLNWLKGGLDRFIIIWNIEKQEAILKLDLETTPRSFALDIHQNFIIAYGNAKHLGYCSFSNSVIRVIHNLEVSYNLNLSSLYMPTLGASRIYYSCKDIIWWRFYTDLLNFKWSKWFKDIAISASLDRTVMIWAAKRAILIKKIVVDELIINIQPSLMAKYIAIKLSNNRIIIYEST